LSKFSNRNLEPDNRRSESALRYHAHSAAVRIFVAVVAALASLACSEAPFVRVTPAGTAMPAATTTAASASASAPAPARSIRIAFVGDLMFARDVTTRMQQEGVQYPFERVRPLWADADLVVGNLEGTYTSRGTALAKEYTFRTPSALAAALTAGGFHAVSLANNHTFDFGTVGLEDTLATLRTKGVALFGAGLDETAAVSPLLVRTPSGLRVAFLGFDDIGEVQFASQTEPGVARADVSRIESAVRRAAADADFVVVVMHWGLEYRSEPTARQRLLAQAAVDAGACVVVGAHPHVLQPWERFGRAVVLFSLGNFVFDLKPGDVDWLGPGPFQTTVAVLTLSLDTSPAVAFRPVMIDPAENRPRPATAAEAASILAQLEPAGPVGR